MTDLTVFYAIGIVLVMVGVVVIVAAIIRASTGSSKGESRVRGAGVIMIGPIPIIFGTDKKSVKNCFGFGVGAFDCYFDYFVGLLLVDWVIYVVE